MSRSLTVLLFLCLSVQPAFAFGINWQERVQRFSQYGAQQAIAQGQRTKALGMQTQSFNKRVEGYVRNLEAQARPLQNDTSSSTPAE